MNGLSFISEVTPEEWLESVPKFSRSHIDALLTSGMTEEEIVGYWLSRKAPTPTAGFGGTQNSANYLASVKAEFRKLVCGDSSYESTREEAASVWKGSGKTMIVSTISSAIAIKLGIAVALLTPVVALMLGAIARVGVNAWCASPPPEPPSLAE